MHHPAIPPAIATAIDQALKRAEQEHDIRVLLAVESGSRAWGFASTDSDWDVRFIYVHRPEWYLRIDDERDVIEQMLPMDIDLAGWELKKALRLFRKSNPPLLEWLRSPLLYQESYSTAEGMRHLAERFFSPVSVSYHYLSMAKRNFAQYLTGDTVRLKKYFYVLRPLLACDWVNATHSMAPMEFDRLVDRSMPSGPLRDAIDALLQQKMTGQELGKADRIPVIHDWIETRLRHYEAHPPQLRQATNAETQDLDALFRATLHEVWR